MGSASQLNCKTVLPGLYLPAYQIALEIKICLLTDHSVCSRTRGDSFAFGRLFQASLQTHLWNSFGVPCIVIHQHQVSLF